MLRSIGASNRRPGLYPGVSNVASTGRWSDAALPANRSGLGPCLCHWNASVSLLWYLFRANALPGDPRLIWLVAIRKAHRELSLASTY